MTLPVPLENFNFFHTDRHRLSFHLMPPTGWMNDPNGLCQRDGIYHIFFQYSPYDANGGDKYWGHYCTKDFVQYEYTGIFLSPDTEYDRNGVFSGSALTEGEDILLYYTGNVEEEGEYDFILSGRGANTILVTTKDGRIASKKQCLLTTDDYPLQLSCHVRDPKVFRHENLYYMVLGGRTKDDIGVVMLYVSNDKKTWSFQKFFIPNNRFGYMWECPDYFELGDQGVLSFSPQGVTHEEYRFQNVYQSGYSLVVNPFLNASNRANSFSDESNQAEFFRDENNVEIDNFTEWDYGFDFYAPQTFLDEKGRRILIGWMGIGDALYTNPTVTDGWQHALTFPRELRMDENKHRIMQTPIAELFNLRRKELTLTIEKGVTYAEDVPMELKISCKAGNNFELLLCDGCRLAYEASSHIFSLEFINDNEKGDACLSGFGRDRRNILFQPDEVLTELQILIDNSSLELFLNQGDYVMTTRYYKTQRFQRFFFTCKGVTVMTVWELGDFAYVL